MAKFPSKFIVLGNMNKFITMFVVVGVLGICAAGGMVYVAYHFIMKVW